MTTHKNKPDAIKYLGFDLSARILIPPLLAPYIISINDVNKPICVVVKLSSLFIYGVENTKLFLTNSLAGDQARAAAKQAAESLKNQVREKLGEGTASAIANAIINGLADTGDAALGSADYAADAAIALVSCAAGDSYCSKAMSDLARKNQAVADNVTALMQSETWSAVADTVKEAAGGNQVALEATGGFFPRAATDLLLKTVQPGDFLHGYASPHCSRYISGLTAHSDNFIRRSLYHLM